MRYSEFKIIKPVLNESNRGIIGTVIDTQAGSGAAASFVKTGGIEYRATEAWKFPSDDRTLRYESSTLTPAYINRLKNEFSDAKLTQDVKNKIEEIVENKSFIDLQLIASSDINVLSTKVAQYLKKQKQPTEYVDADEQFARELKNETGMDINTVKWVGGMKPASGFAALVVELTSNKGREWVGKYYKSKRPDGHIFWQVSEFLRDIEKVGIKLQSKKGATSKGVSTQIHLGPKELGITNKIIDLNRLPTAIARGAEANSNISEQEKKSIVGLVKNLGGDATTINPEYKTNYEVQLGEVVAPLAICKGINVSGAITQAENQLVSLLDPGAKFSNIQKVEYPDNIAEKLVDSYLITPNNSRIGVSSKDKKGGAAASITGIIETIDEKLDTIKERVPNFETRYAQYLRWLKVIKASTGKSVAFNLAVAMRIISQDVARQALEALGKNPGDVKSLKAIDRGSFYKLTIGYPRYNPEIKHPMYRIHYHAAASLARIVAERFNEDKKKTNSFFATVLESSNMIQVLAKLDAKGDQASFSDFKVIYPPVFDGDIKLNAGSYFFATKPPQGFTFKIK